MEYTIINAILYVVTLFIYWRYKRQLDLGFIILAAFTLIAIFGVLHQYFLDIVYNPNITMLPYVYLYLILLLFLSPYLNANGNFAHKIKVRSQKKLELIAYLFIISSFISIYALLPFALENIRSGEWDQVRYELYKGDSPIFYRNFLEHIALIFNQYFLLISILIFFYFLTLQKHGKTFLLVLGLSCVIPIFLLSICTASRGIITKLMMEFVAGFFIFRTQLSLSIKKMLLASLAIFLTLALIYSMSVTIARFGESSGNKNTGLTSGLSLLDYFGQPMLVFNDGVANMHDYAYGKYFFKYILDVLEFDSSINQNELGGHWGTSFFTFVGAFYIDFGPVGTFLLALILPYSIKKNITGNVIYFENLFLYSFFYIFFLQGIFVTGYSSIISWLFAVLIYCLLKFKLVKIK